MRRRTLALVGAVLLLATAACSGTHNTADDRPPPTIVPGKDYTLTPCRSGNIPTCSMTFNRPTTVSFVLIYEDCNNSGLGDKPPADVDTCTLQKLREQKRKFDEPWLQETWDTYTAPRSQQDLPYALSPLTQKLMQLGGYDPECLVLAMEIGPDGHHSPVAMQGACPN